MRKKDLLGLLAMLAVSLTASIPEVLAGQAGDAEAASHGDEAATVTLVADTTIDRPALVFRQYNLAVLSHYSYMVGSKGEALVVDPARDVSRYLDDARSLGLKITRVYLTHSHADFVAGHTELAAVTGAKVWVSGQSGARYPHDPITDGQELPFGALTLRVLATPGHTPDGTSLVVDDPDERGKPLLVFTGDTLFIGSMGRPDLLGGTVAASSLAAMAYRSWHEKLGKLPEQTRVFPAHGAGSLCGVHLEDRPVSTIGEQRRTNGYLRHTSQNGFVMAMLEGLPKAPQYFAHNVQLNREGPPLIDRARGGPRALRPVEAAEMARKGAWLVDLRDSKAFSRGHAEGAVNIGIRGRFETWVGAMVPWGEPLILMGSEAEVKEAATRLYRIGYDSPAGQVAGGFESWSQSALPTRKIALVEPKELQRQMQAGAAPIVVDVRLPSEWAARRIGDVLNIPIDVLDPQARKIEPSQPVLTVCNSAYRSSMAASVLERMGFTDLRNLQGGGEAWIAAGLPTRGQPAPAAAAPVSVPHSVDLPEPIGPEDLARRLMDMPGSLDLVDIRPAWQFAEFSIPGSVNVTIERLVSEHGGGSGRKPLVIACRDGHLAAAVAGNLVGRTSRPVHFLVGGVVRYHDEILRPAGIQLDRRPGQVDRPAPSTEGGARGGDRAPATAPPPPHTPSVRKRSAGC